MNVPASFFFFIFIDLQTHIVVFFLSLKEKKEHKQQLYSSLDKTE